MFDLLLIDEIMFVLLMSDVGYARCHHQFSFLRLFGFSGKITLKVMKNIILFLVAGEFPADSPATFIAGCAFCCGFLD